MTTPKVLLIGWDAADWEHMTPLLESGLLPHVDQMINRGVMGNLATLEPMLSPMVWNSIATGKLPEKHGIHGFIEPDPVHGGVRPYPSTSRKVKALWNILSQSGLRSNVVGWWASHPAEPIRGCVVTNHFTRVKFVPGRGWQVPAGTIYPQERAAFLSQFRVMPQELTHEHIFPFIPHAEKLDQLNDPLVQTFGKVLSDCASIHAVATAVAETEPWDFLAVYYDAIDHFCHAFMRFHPPRMPEIPEEQFELYKDVVSGAYRFHDLMLARWFELVPEDTTIILCSDHGFQSRKLRPQAIPREPAGPAAWHRELGVFLAMGPGIRRDERIYGASVLDICPTVLHAFGLPVGADMDGRPLVQIYTAPPPVARISSWEDVPGASGEHPPGTVLDEVDASELVRQFVALGYVEDPGSDQAQAAENARIECSYNLARSLLWSGSVDQALPLLEDISRQRPWESRFLQVLARAYHAGGYLRQAERVIQAMYPGDAPVPPLTRIALGEIKYRLGDRRTALQLLHEVAVDQPRAPRLQIRLGETYLRLRCWQDAERAFQRALECCDDAARAWQGLSTVYRRWGKNHAAVETALRAVHHLYSLPDAHFNLGVALARTGDTERAIVAFGTALKFRPTMLNAHRWLAHLYAADPQQSDHVRAHRREIARLLAAQQQARRDRQRRCDVLFELPAIPPIDQRLAALNQERPLPRDPSEKSGKLFVLVSGLPRSGTSLMMQMLEAGGLSVVTDGKRSADADNPRGYYEWEELKQIGRRPGLLDADALDRNGIKVISMLLPKMPAWHSYRVIFMLRPIEQVVASQSQMLLRRGMPGGTLDPDALRRQLTAHREDILRWLATAPHMQVLQVDYPTLVQSPGEVIPQLATFLGPDLLPRPEAMLSAIDEALYRQRNPVMEAER